MLDFFTNLFDFLTSSVEFILNFIVYILNLFIYLFCSILNLFSSIFPNSPFSNVGSYTFGIEEYLGYLNWLIPIQVILNITFAWVGCMMIYWSYGFIMRTIKLID